MLTMHTFAKYDLKYALTTPRSPVKKIISTPLEPWKIQKMDGVGPGSYEFDRAFDKTQKPKEYLIAKNTSNRTVFTDSYAKLYKQYPAPDAYKDIDKGYKLQGTGTFDTLNQQVKLD